jgi:hypothetical protein
VTSPYLNQPPVSIEDVVISLHQYRWGNGAALCRCGWAEPAESEGVGWLTHQNHLAEMIARAKGREE